jgi:hypothetical protein
VGDLLITAKYGAGVYNLLYWMGGTDLCNEGFWRWCYGNNESSLIDRVNTPFLPGQPDNWGNGEECAMTADLAICGLNDQKCSDALNYVCEV